MPESDDRIENLEQKVRRLLAGMLVLAGVLMGTFLIVVMQATSDELTVRRLAIVDNDGKERIVAGTLPSGQASVLHYDSDGKMRIATATLSTGEAAVEHYDRDEKMRISVRTFPGGEASVLHYDRDGKKRITTATQSDGTALIGIGDDKGKAVWGKTSK